MTATAVSGSLLAYSIYQLKPELVPAGEHESSGSTSLDAQVDWLSRTVLPTAHAEAELSSKLYIDPTTSTSFPTSITSPDGKRLALVGTGVRTVSFLSIRVYAAAFYVEESALRGLSRVNGFQVSRSCGHSGARR